MPMTPQPHEVKRVPVGSERPARVHVIWHNRKFVGYTVRLEAGQEKWQRSLLTGHWSAKRTRTSKRYPCSPLMPRSHLRRPAFTWMARPQLPSAGADSPGGADPQGPGRISDR